MLKNTIRVIIVIVAAILGLLIGEALNSLFGGADINFSPITAIVFSIAASCAIICESYKK